MNRKGWNHTREYLFDLNLPMLLNRKELVMSKEDGVYVVDLPSALKTTPKKKKR